MCYLFASQICSNVKFSDQTLFLVSNEYLSYDLKLPIKNKDNVMIQHA